MKPDFALSLSFDGITLLRRVDGGWAVVDEVALDAADLSGALAELRVQADALSPKGGQVKLVVPNEQIKYLSLAAPRKKAALRDAIEAALEGATPYSVADLVYDWSRKGDTLLVAAVARDTLQEAQEFTESHHFVPVSYVAVAPPGKFDGEVFFGPAPNWSGPAPERDTAAILRVAAPVETVPAETVPAETVPTVPKPGPEAEAEAATGSSAAADPASGSASETDQDKGASAVSASVAHSVQDQAADSAAASAGDAKADQAPAAAGGKKSDAEPGRQPKRETLRVAPASQGEQGKSPAPGITTPVDSTTQTPAPAFSSIRATRDAPAAAQPIRMERSLPAAGRSRINPLPPKDAERGEPQTSEASTEMPPRLAAIKAAAAAAPSPPPEPPAQLARSLEREESAPETPVASATLAAPDEAPRAFGGLRRKFKPAKPAKPGTPAMAGKTPAPAAVAMADERERMTVFGARQGNGQIGGKPRFLGLILTTVLLVFLAAVAAWASVFLDDGLARFFRPDVAPSVAVADPEVAAPSISDEIAADAPDEMAALDPASPAQPPAQDLRQPEPLTPPTTRPRALTPQEAEATYAATGIWQRAPVTPMEPQQDALDGLYVASIDTQVQQFDAVALPTALAPESPGFASPPDPAPAGVVFDLDARGLVRAVPEGAMNPDGVLVYAGQPPAVPPLRGITPLQDPVESPEDRAIRDRIERLRPQLRPDDIVELNERATLAGRSRSELAALRPTARPDVDKLADEADVTATDLAIDASPKPLPRPRDIARIVEEARARTPDPAPSVQVASAASVAPRIPSSASVAQQATVRNALNLRRINLIGVYGKPSNRRALVRLSNGRYQKVQVGDRIDGGRVAAIGAAELRYTKGGRNIVLEMPDG